MFNEQCSSSVLFWSKPNPVICHTSAGWFSLCQKISTIGHTYPDCTMWPWFNRSSTVTLTVCTRVYPPSQDSRPNLQNIFSNVNLWFLWLPVLMLSKSGMKSVSPAPTQCPLIHAESQISVIFCTNLAKSHFWLLLQIAFLFWRPWNDSSAVSHQMERRKNNDCKAPKTFSQYCGWKVTHRNF